MEETYRRGTTQQGGLTAVQGKISPHMQYIAYIMME